MSTIERIRVIRPSTRKKDSPYKVDTSNVGNKDTLQIIITHENDPSTPLFIYEVEGPEVSGKKSISFRVYEEGTSWNLKFYGANVKRKY